MKYLALIKIQFKDNFTYRMSTIAGILVGIFQVSILYYIWCAVFNEEKYMQGYSLKQMITYVIFSTVMYRMIELGITLRVSDLVKSGDIANKLTKPMGFISSLVCESLGILFANIIVTVIPIAVFSFLTIGGFFQTDLVALALFTLSFVLALYISIYIDILFGLLTFWTENGWGLRVIRQAMIKIFSGALLPLAIMPGWLQSICNILPFKTLVDIPLNIYIFGVTRKTIFNLTYQITWIIVLILLRFIWYYIIYHQFKYS